MRSLPLLALPFLAACPIRESDDADPVACECREDTGDTGSGGDTADTADTGSGGETGDTADTADTAAAGPTASPPRAR